jgi:phosphate:Na+ symporter
VIDALTQELKVRHIQRVQEGRCTLELGFIFNDCINNFERVADHCSNIAVAILEGTDASVQSHAYLHSLKENDRDEYRERFNEWAKKYYDALVAVE